MGNYYPMKLPPLEAASKQRIAKHTSAAVADTVALLDDLCYTARSIKHRDYNGFLCINGTIVKAILKIREQVESNASIRFSAVWLECDRLNNTIPAPLEIINIITANGYPPGLDSIIPKGIIFALDTELLRFREWIQTSEAMVVNTKKLLDAIDVFLRCIRQPPIQAKDGYGRLLALVQSSNIESIKRAAADIDDSSNEYLNRLLSSCSRLTTTPTMPAALFSNDVHKHQCDAAIPWLVIDNIAERTDDYYHAMAHIYEHG